MKSILQLSVTISTFPKISTTYFINIFAFFIFCMNYWYIN